MDVIALRLDILARCVSVPMSGDHLVERKGQDQIVRFDVSCDIFCDCQILEWCPPRKYDIDLHKHPLPRGVDGDISGFVVVASVRQSQRLMAYLQLILVVEGHSGQGPGLAAGEWSVRRDAAF